MSAINENLKQIRRAKGFTQEDVARQIGVTRQAISSYESNRTQPDPETLKRFAEVYDVEFNDILYGTNRMQIKRKNIKIVAIISLVDLLVCNVGQSILIWIANKYFAVETGAVAESSIPILNTRMILLNAHNAIETVSMISFSLCCIMLLILLIALDRPVALSTKLNYFAILILGSVITILPWSLCDNTYSLIDYSYAALQNLLFAAVILGLSFIGEHIHKKAKK